MKESIGCVNQLDGIRPDWDIIGNTANSSSLLLVSGGLGLWSLGADDKPPTSGTTPAPGGLSDAPSSRVSALRDPAPPRRRQDRVHMASRGRDDRHHLKAATCRISRNARLWGPTAPFPIALAFFLIDEGMSSIFSTPQVGLNLTLWAGHHDLLCQLRLAKRLPKAKVDVGGVGMFLLLFEVT